MRLTVSLSGLPKALDELPVFYKRAAPGKSSCGAQFEMHPTTKLPIALLNGAALKTESTDDVLYTLFMVCPGDSKGYGCEPNTNVSAKSARRCCRVQLRIDVTRDAADPSSLLAHLTEVGSHGPQHFAPPSTRTWYRTKMLAQQLLLSGNASTSKLRSEVVDKIGLNGSDSLAALTNRLNARLQYAKKKKRRQSSVLVDNNDNNDDEKRKRRKLIDNSNDDTKKKDLFLSTLLGELKKENQRTIINANDNNNNDNGNADVVREAVVAEDESVVVNIDDDNYGDFGSFVDVPENNHSVTTTIKLDKIEIIHSEQRKTNNDINNNFEEQRLKTFTNLDNDDDDDETQQYSTTIDTRKNFEPLLLKTATDVNNDDEDEKNDDDENDSNNETLIRDIAIRRSYKGYILLFPFLFRACSLLNQQCVQICSLEVSFNRFSTR